VTRLTYITNELRTPIVSVKPAISPTRSSFMTVAYKRGRVITATSADAVVAIHQCRSISSLPFNFNLDALSLLTYLRHDTSHAALRSRSRLKDTTGIVLLAPLTQRSPTRPT